MSKPERTIQSPRRGSVRLPKRAKLNSPPDHRVLLTCRHHACEMMASWTLEGIMEAVLADGDDGRWLRDHVEFLVVPFMDKDGVEDGDQGKDRRPHDHNQDYLLESIYPSVATLRQFVPEWSDGRLRVSLDLHCPDLRVCGDIPGSNERIFFVGTPSQRNRDNLDEFSRVLERVQTGPLVYSSRHNLRWGQSWNTEPKPRSCSRWADLLPNMWLSAILEVPYCDAAGKAVTANSARMSGHDLARAIRQFLEEDAQERQPSDKTSPSRRA